MEAKSLKIKASVASTGEHSSPVKNTHTHTNTKCRNFTQTNADKMSAFACVKNGGICLCVGI